MANDEPGELGGWARSISRRWNLATCAGVAAGQLHGYHSALQRLSRQYRLSMIPKKHFWCSVSLEGCPETDSRNLTKQRK